MEGGRRVMVGWQVRGSRLVGRPRDGVWLVGWPVGRRRLVDGVWLVGWLVVGRWA
jgi:hypothetical protein